MGTKTIYGKTTTTQTLGDDAYGAPILLMGDVAVQITQGTDASALTVQRHPITDNNPKADAPLEASADWAPDPSSTDVAGAAGQVIRFSEPGAAWYRFKIANGAHIAVTATSVGVM